MSDKPKFDKMTVDQMVQWLSDAGQAPERKPSKSVAIALCEAAWAKANPGPGDEEEVVADDPTAGADEEVVAGEDEPAEPAQEPAAAAADQQPETPEEPVVAVIPIDRPEGFLDAEWGAVCREFSELREDLRDEYIAMVKATAAFVCKKRIVPPEAPPAPPGMVVLYAPAGATSISQGGANYDVVDGMVTVPFGAISDLQAHGYSTTPIL